MATEESPGTPWAAWGGPGGARGTSLGKVVKNPRREEGVREEGEMLL